MDVQRDAGHFKTGPLRFASPDQLWVKMRIVLVGFPWRLHWIRFARHQADRRVIHPLLVRVRVLLDPPLLRALNLPLCLRYLLLRHLASSHAADRNEVACSLAVESGANQNFRGMFRF
jgi:hypothetical protein